LGARPTGEFLSILWASRNFLKIPNPTLLASAAAANGMIWCGSRLYPKITQVQDWVIVQSYRCDPNMCVDLSV
jgi:hypothetical protein